MENKTVKELKEIAKERKIKYYYKLRKEDLVRALQPIVHQAESLLSSRPVAAPRSIAQSPIVQIPVVQRPIPAPRPVRSILDEPIPSSVSSPVLTPGIFSRFTAAAKSTASSVLKSTASYVANTFTEIKDWIKPYVPEVVEKQVSEAGKQIDKKIKFIKPLVSKTVYKPLIEFKLTNHAVKNVTRQYSYEAEGNQQDASVFLDTVREGVMKILRENKNKKVNFVLKCHMSRMSIVTGEEITRTVPFACKYVIVLEATDLGELYNTSKGEILENIAKYSSNGSNWRVSSILKMDVNVINYSPLSASSWIELSNPLKEKKAIINMQSNDNECFKWCVTRALNMKKNYPERIDKELIEKSKEFHWEGIEFPVKLDQIEKFEKNNADISVSVFGFEDKKFHPLKKLKYFDRKYHIDLLLISNETTNHYCLINNFSRLIASSTSKNEHKKYFCRNCLQGYYSKEALAKHWNYCKEHSFARVELPKEGSSVRFNHVERSMRVPFVMYADFESRIIPINTCSPNEKQSFTKQYQKHIPSSYCYYIKCFDETVNKGKLTTYTAMSETDEVAGKFVESIEKDITDICESNKFPKKIVMSDED